MWWGRKGERALGSAGALSVRCSCSEQVHLVWEVSGDRGHKWTPPCESSGGRPWEQREESPQACSLGQLIELWRKEMRVWLSIRGTCVEVGAAHSQGWVLSHLRLSRGGGCRAGARGFLLDCRGRDKGTSKEGSLGRGGSRARTRPLLGVATALAFPPAPPFEGKKPQIFKLVDHSSNCST